ncbi:D-glutamate cyclase family protein [Variovorax sp. HJSM1_2]|uniref:D-glutamate cyclase family protein n=1 Tax=Variovorax sp. HJSM1_2 TaxID=3366263 RepID=UPI003BC29E5A
MRAGKDGLELTPREVRRLARSGQALMTSGLAPGYLQGNLLVLPQALAHEFADFCRRNPVPLPLLALGCPGDPTLPTLGEDIDVRRDLGAYQIWHNGAVQAEVADLCSFWRDDDVALVLGCWFSQEAALAAAGVYMRHIERGVQGGLFCTQLLCQPTEHFGGPVVVSARPFQHADVETVVRLTALLPEGHGAPLHRGDPAALGIEDIARPDFGEPLPPQPGETMLYWGCGLTAVEALRRAGVARFATHQPGCMLVTDRRAAAQPFSDLEANL